MTCTDGIPGKLPCFLEFLCFKTISDDRPRIIYACAEDGSLATEILVEFIRANTNGAATDWCYICALVNVISQLRGSHYEP